MLVRRRVDFERRMRRLPPLTAALCAVLAAVFTAEASLEILDSAEALLLAGALSRDAVLAGQWWRLVSAVFLHGSLQHLLGNLIALFVLGMVCEHAFGRRQFLWLFVVSGIAGSVASMLTSPGPSVGASGAIFGLQGAAVVLFRRYRARLLVRDRRIGLVLIVWALFSIAQGVLTPFVDNGAHVGGLVAGAVLARFLHPVVLDAPSEDDTARMRRKGWIAGLILAAAALGWVLS
jgi:rhomboid protease GluP